MKNLELPVSLLCIALIFGGALACDLGATGQPTPASEEATAAPPAAEITSTPIPAEVTPTPVPPATPLSFAEVVPSPEVETPSPSPPPAVTLVLATPPPTATTPVPADTPPPPTPAGSAVTPIGRYGQVWERWGGAGGPLGWGLTPAVEGFYAGQHFERGLMHWGRLDTIGKPDYEIQVIVYGEGGNTKTGDMWGRYEDYWKEWDEDYSCPEAKPPLGPKRGFGLVWCKHVRDFLGAPLEEEWGEQGGYQDFQGGTMLWMPRNGGIYVLLNRGDWHFEPVE